MGIFKISENLELKYFKRENRDLAISLEYNKHEKLT